MHKLLTSPDLKKAGGPEGVGGGGGGGRLPPCIPQWAVWYNYMVWGPLFLVLLISIKFFCNLNYFFLLFKLLFFLVIDFPSFKGLPIKISIMSD